MIYQLKYFGKLAELSNHKAEAIEFNGRTAGELKTWIKSRYPIFENESFKIAVNQKLVEDDYIIEDGSELALLPPFAGG